MIARPFAALTQDAEAQRKEGRCKALIAIRRTATGSESDISSSLRKLGSGTVP